jgi:glycosyltransferase involved in cell wall biosynthesis
MKLGIVIGSLGYGGAERVTVRLSEWFIKRQYQVSIYTTMTPPDQEYHISQKIKRFKCHLLGNGVSLIQCLRKTIKKDAPDIIIIMDTPMCVYAVPAILGLKIPFIVSERSNPNTDAIKRKTKILAHFLMKFADGFIFQTSGAQNYYDKAIQKRSSVIPNPIVLSEIPLPYRGERSKRIVAVGRLIPAKDYPFLLDAFDSFSSEYPEYTLEIYGDGADKEKIEIILSSLIHKDKVILMGAHSDVLEKIKNAEMYVLSSKLEGMPNALIEAMAIGLPSIATDCPSGGPADLIENKINGILIPVGDKEKLVAAFKELADNLNLRNTLSENAIKIRERLDIEIIGSQWEKNINGIVHNIG